jgi:hypothetical protein
MMAMPMAHWLPSQILPRRRIAAVVTCGVLLTALVAAQPVTAPRTPQVSMQVPVPPALVAMEGLDQMVYELHLENRGDVPVTLSSLELHFDPTPLGMKIDGAQLTRALDVPDDRATPHVIPAGARRVVYMDIRAVYDRRGVAVKPARIRHRLRFTVSGVGDTISDDGEGLVVDARPPVVLGPPLAGGPWAAVHHPDWARGHRRVFYTVDGRTRLPGRYTIDFVRLDEQGRTARGDADLVTSALGYGASVLAVADATVAAVRDTLLEASRVSAGVKHPPDEAAGNYVSLDLGDGRFAVFEHLKPGSLRVRSGQRVRRGDVVAQLGFTGDSTGPHLHLHVGDAAAPLAAEGLPFVFDRFEVLGRYLDIAKMGSTRWSLEGTGRRQNERPGPNVVIDFGAAAP